MAFIITDNIAGLLPITNHDTPATVETIGSTTVTDVKVPLGTIVRAVDPTYGEGEFIRLLGVASTVVGSMVTYNATTWQTALAPNTANLAQPVAFAMSACVAGEHGWYQISGLAVAKKTAVAVSPQVVMYVSGTTGRVMPTSASGKQILGCRSANLTSVTATTSTVVLSINRPHMQGRVT